MKRTNVGGFIRVSKRTAERLYHAGHTIRLCACKLSPVNVQGMFADANQKNYTSVCSDGFNTTVARDKTFNTVANAFKYYNCNHETGYYPAFYIRNN